MLYFTHQTKRGKWRLYRLIDQAVTAWKGSNEKVEVVRDYLDSITETYSREAIVAYCQENFKVTPLQSTELDLPDRFK